jgi:hypothetical protein
MGKFWHESMKLIYHFPSECFYVDFFVNPIPAIAMLGMTLNDHCLKRQFPSWWTGKISDFLGMFYFPVFLCAISCLVWNFVFRPFLKNPRVAYISPTLMLVCMAITAVLMLSIKMSPVVALEVQTLFSQLLFPIRITSDPTDIASFLSLPLSYFYAKSFFAYRPHARAEPG